MSDEKEKFEEVEVMFSLGLFDTLESCKVFF